MARHTDIECLRGLHSSSVVAQVFLVAENKHTLTPCSLNDVVDAASLLAARARTASNLLICDSCLSSKLAYLSLLVSSALLTSKSSRSAKQTLSAIVSKLAVLLVKKSSNLTLNASRSLCSANTEPDNMSALAFNTSPTALSFVISTAISCLTASSS